MFEDNLLFEDSTFPIPYDTEVAVTCQSGYSLVGDQIITCEKDTYYIYKTRPLCGDECKYSKRVFSTLPSNSVIRIFNFEILKTIYYDTHNIFYCLYYKYSD